VQANAWPISSNLYGPISDAFNILDLKNIAISITGFCGPDLLHVEQLITLLGADFYNNLTRKRSLLLTPDDQTKGSKQLKAKEWGVPIVNVEWLWEVIRQGEEEVDIAPWCDRPGGMD
jgi:hypothetical protein